MRNHPNIRVSCSDMAAADSKVGLDKTLIVVSRMPTMDQVDGNMAVDEVLTCCSDSQPDVSGYR